MKLYGKIVLILLALITALICSGCGKEAVPGGDPSGASFSVKRFEKISQEEYILYQNFFYNGYAKDFVGKKVKKEGVLTVLHDAFNSTERYYVTGYADQTKCCDWQWEFVPPEGAELPPVGSLVTVEGTFTYDEQNALDKYRITNTTLKTKKSFGEPAYEINMYVMGDTLERVQLANFKQFPAVFENKEFIAYGRIKALDVLQDPYYDGSWEIGFVWDGTAPKLGTTVVMTGTFSSDGKLNVTALQSID
ncbi:MAG: hypothetical protein J6Z04_04940 [Clostridia bacterium]|nr:hypothetical protein [Clostridia bacterium]